MFYNLFIFYNIIFDFVFKRRYFVLVNKIYLNGKMAIKVLLYFTICDTNCGFYRMFPIANQK